MKSSRTIIVFVSITASVLLVAALFVSLQQPSLRASASQENAFASMVFEDYLKPTPNTVYTTTPFSRDDFIVQRTANQLKISYPISLGVRSRKKVPTETVEVPPSTQTAIFSDGSYVPVLAIQTNYRNGPEETDNVVSAYDPVTLQPITDADFQKNYGKMLAEPVRHKRQESPRLALLLGKGAKPTQFNIYDAHTKNWIPGAHSASYGVSLTTYEFDRSLISQPIYRWHSSPIIVVIDFDHGDSTEVPIEFKEGNSFQIPGLEVQISRIEMLDCPVMSTSRSHNGTKRLFSAKLDSTREHEIMVVAFSASKIAELPSELTLHFETLEGNEVTENLNFSEGAVVHIFPNVSLKKIRRAWISYQRGHSRAVFRFDKIPGLPAKNDNLENLFDAYVPYTEVESNLHFYLARATQLEAGSLQALHDIPNSEYPLIFQDTTIQQMLNHLKQRTGAFRLMVDGNQLRGRKSPSAWTQERWKKLKRKFK